MKEIKRGSDMYVKWEGVHGEETRGGRERGGRREKERISENRNKGRGEAFVEKSYGLFTCLV